MSKTQPGTKVLDDPKTVKVIDTDIVESGALSSEIPGLTPTNPLKYYLKHNDKTPVQGGITLKHAARDFIFAQVNVDRAEDAKNITVTLDDKGEEGKRFSYRKEANGSYGIYYDEGSRGAGDAPKLAYMGMVSFTDRDGNQIPAEGLKIKFRDEKGKISDVYHDVDNEKADRQHEAENRQTAINNKNLQTQIDNDWQAIDNAEKNKIAKKRQETDEKERDAKNTEMSTVIDAIDAMDYKPAGGDSRPAQPGDEAPSMTDGEITKKGLGEFDKLVNWRQATYRGRTELSNGQINATARQIYAADGAEATANYLNRVATMLSPEHAQPLFTAADVEGRVKTALSNREKGQSKENAFNTMLFTDNMSVHMDDIVRIKKLDDTYLAMKNDKDHNPFHFVDKTLQVKDVKETLGIPAGGKSRDDGALSMN